MEEIGQTVSDKARRTIVLAVRVILYVQPHYGYDATNTNDIYYTRVFKAIVRPSLRALKMA